MAGLGVLPQRAWAGVALCAAALVQPACGVRQFNARMPPPAVGQKFTGYGPFLASGQRGESMSPSSCGTSGVGRPCIRARASIGIPYQFDQNSYRQTVEGPPGVYSPTGSPPYTYTTAAGAGYVGPTMPTGGHAAVFGNKDLSLMVNQTHGGEHVFP